VDLEPFLTQFEPSSEAIRAVVEPALSSVGLELVQLQFVRGNHKDTLRLFVDVRGAGGISVAQLEKANRLLSDLLDVEDRERHLFPHAYDLEVGSPGLDRPLTKKSHFARAAGQKVRVKTKAAIDNARSFTGDLAVNDDVVIVDGHRIPFDDIHSAHVVYVFEAPAKPGKKQQR
jgi:ribosome maturation factor RimP